MKVYSTDKPETYVASGSELRIHWGMQEITVGESTQWEANEALCNIYDTRGQIIEKIIGSVMDTGAEIAAINNRDTDPEEYAEYQAFRALAKQLADGWVNREAA